MGATKHRGAKLDVPGIRFVSGECECENCDGWLWSRHLVKGTRLEPHLIWDQYQAGESVERIAEFYEGLTVKQVEAAIEWSRRRRGKE